jgi:hypothetical protein
MFSRKCWGSAVFSDISSESGDPRDARQNIGWQAFVGCIELSKKSLRKIGQVFR